MAQKILTDLKIRNAKISAGERLLADGSGLFLRVRPDRKDWVFIYSLANRRRKQGLGSYPDVTLERAREKANESRARVADGQDAIQAAAAALKVRRATEAARASRLSVAALFEAWHFQEASRRKDGGKEIRRAMQKDVLPKIGARYADEVSRKDVMAVLDAVTKRKANRYANLLLQYVRQMFWYAIAREIIQTDPTSAIVRRNVGGRERERERILSEEEIRSLQDKLSDSDLTPQAQAAIWVMLGTCCRIGELTKAKWEHFDFSSGTWWIPPENSKNGRQHLFHLSAFAKRHLKTIQDLKLSAIWLFPNVTDDGYLDTKALQKHFRDRQLEVAMKKRSPKVATLRLEGGRWTAHDLRRTGATMMGELGIRPDVIDRVLNHIEERKVTRTYQRQDLLPERKNALMVLGDRLEVLHRRGPDDVARRIEGTNVVVVNFGRRGTASGGVG